MILSMVLLGDSPITLSELARFSGSSSSTIAKEVKILARHEVVATAQQGRNILGKPRTRVRNLVARVTLLMSAVGPVKELPQEFFSVKGVVQLYIYRVRVNPFGIGSNPPNRNSRKVRDLLLKQGLCLSEGISTRAKVRRVCEGNIVVPKH